MGIFCFIISIFPLSVSFFLNIRQNFKKLRPSKNLKIIFLREKVSGRFEEVNFYAIFHSGNEKVAGLQMMAGLSWPVYGGNFIKDPMGVWQGNELLAGL